MISRRGLLKAAAAAGLLFSAAICAVLITLARHPQGSPGDRFYRALRDYDRIFAARGEGEKGTPKEGEKETLVALLDRIEKNVQGVESWLSLLKRRRALARVHPETLPRYQEALRRAAAAFPWSEPLAALACSLPEDAGDQSSRDYGARISEPRLMPLALAAAILRGDFADPARAAESRGEAFLSVGLPLIRSGLSPEREDRLIINLALLRIIRRDYARAEAQLQGLSRPQGAFLAEYYYDFADPLRAAEIFNRAGETERSADALWLGGKIENAANIWRTLGGAGGETGLRSLYNLASFPEERERRLGQLYHAGEGETSLRGKAPYVYGLIGYTRGLPPHGALEILEDRLRDLAPDLAALRDLEILRRRGELWTPERTGAEAWLLLGGYPEDPRLYRWAAWFFSFQRRREDGAILVKTAGYRGIRDPWLGLSAALNDLGAGRLDQAEEGLRSIIAESGPVWQAEANLGLILEARRESAEALRYYEQAADKLAGGNPAGGRVQDRRAAGRLQLRIAGCLRSLGRGEESRRALLHSLDLNPGSLAARLELQRLEEE